MRTIILGVLAVLVVGSGSAAQVPQPDPAKSATTPWTLDPRCAIMAAHPRNQGALTSACVAQDAHRAYLNQAPGYHSSQSQTQHSHTDRKPRSPRED